jgi:hypothetical protein
LLKLMSVEPSLTELWLLAFRHADFTVSHSVADSFCDAIIRVLNKATGSPELIVRRFSDMRNVPTRRSRCTDRTRT